MPQPASDQQRETESEVRMNGSNFKEEKGAAAVEFAIIMILLLIIVFGIVEFGIAFSKVNVYTGAAREGARYAATRCSTNPPCDNTKIAARVSNAAVGYAIGPGSPTADKVCSDSTLGESVTVSWNQSISVNIPFVPGLNPATYTRIVKGVFRCE
jgi:Flp pilus assembly protein TadG